MAQKAKDCRELRKQTKAVISLQWDALLAEQQMSRGVKMFDCLFFKSIKHLSQLTLYTKVIFVVTDPEALFSWSEEEIADLHDHCTVIMAADGMEM